MEKIFYKIKLNNIPQIKLVSLTSQNWYDSNGNLVPWTGVTYNGPANGDIIYNTNTGLTIGYYRWSGSTWSNISKSTAYPSYNIPLFLECTSTELGNMVGFDGDIEQIEQLVNFSYTQTGSTIQVYSTTNPNKLRKIVEQTFTIDFGDGYVSGLTVNQGVMGVLLPTITHVYSGVSEYKITIRLECPWTTQELSKIVTIPQDISISNPLGTFTGVTLPAYDQGVEVQNYLNNLDYTNNTGYTTFTYLAIGSSRISELRLYGSSQYSGVTTGITDNMVYSGYTIDGLKYRDYPDGYTLITGNTSGYTQDVVYNACLTRNEHFLGFVEDPQIFSDVFVERGKQGVSEKNLRLGEIDNVGEIDLYGNGFYKINNQ